MSKIVAMNSLLFILAAAIVIISGCSEDTGDSDDDIKSIMTPTDLIPGDEDISGWQGLGAYEEANDFDGLYGIINGGAEAYIDEGFVSAAFQIYENCIGGACSLALVNVRIYDQGSSANSLAVYHKVSTGIGIPWSGAGTEARVDESGLAAYTIEFWQQNFFVQVTIDEKTDDALNIAKLFASHISSQIR